MMNLIGQLKALIDQAEKLGPETNRFISPSDDAFNKRQQRVIRWMTNCESVIQFAALPTYLTKFFEAQRGRASDSWKIAQVAGLLQSAIDMLEGGFIGNLRTLVQAEILDSVVDQADSLLKSGHVLPAAVLSRVVLERWLRDQAGSSGIPEADTARASTLNDKLKKAGKLSTTKWRQIQGGLDVGNAAAHGKVDEFSRDDVIRLLVFVRGISA